MCYYNWDKQATLVSENIIKHLLWVLWINLIMACRLAFILVYFCINMTCQHIPLNVIITIELLMWNSKQCTYFPILPKIILLLNPNLIYIKVTSKRVKFKCSVAYCLTQNGSCMKCEPKTKKNNDSKKELHIKVKIKSIELKTTKKIS